MVEDNFKAAEKGPEGNDVGHMTLQATLPSFCVCTRASAALSPPMQCPSHSRIAWRSAAWVERTAEGWNQLHTHSKAHAVRDSSSNGDSRLYTACYVRHGTPVLHLAILH